MFNWFSKKNTQKEQIQIKEEPIISKSIQEIELEFHLNQLVICVSNEVDNLTVGYGKEIVHITQAKQPRLVVYDIVNQKEILPLGTIFTYTEQKFNALNKLEPNERIAIIYNRLDDDIVEKYPSDGDVIYPAEIWKQKVDDAIKGWKKSQLSVM